MYLDVIDCLAVTLRWCAKKRQDNKEDSVKQLALLI